MVFGNQEQLQFAQHFLELYGQFISENASDDRSLDEFMHWLMDELAIGSAANDIIGGSH